MGKTATDEGANDRWKVPSNSRRTAVSFARSSRRTRLRRPPGSTICVRPPLPWMRRRRRCGLRSRPSAPRPQCCWRSRFSPALHRTPTAPFSAAYRSHVLSSRGMRALALVCAVLTCGVWCRRRCRRWCASRRNPTTASQRRPKNSTSCWLKTAPLVEHTTMVYLAIMRIPHTSVCAHVYVMCVK